MTGPMPAHPDAYKALAVRLQVAKTQQERDELLDQWNAYKNQASEWDAESWGFDPDGWLRPERQQMDERAARAAARAAIQRREDGGSE